MEEFEKEVSVEPAETESRAADASEHAPETESAETIVTAEAETVANPDKKSKKDSFWDDVVWFAKALLIGCIVALFVRFVTPLIFVDGESMNQTLYDKELCVGCTLLTPHQGDIVIFKNKRTNNKIYIKRVIGEPGDTVEILSGDVYINGEALDESAYKYISEGDEAYKGRGYVQNSPYTDMSLTLSDNQYFVCGDNRNNSQDSRIIGAINKDDIIATVVIRLDTRWFTNLFHKNSEESD